MHLHTEHHRFCASFKYFSVRLDKACFSVHLSPSPSSSLPLLCTLQSVCLLVRYEVQLLWLRKRSTSQHIFSDRPCGDVSLVRLRSEKQIQVRLHMSGLDGFDIIRAWPIIIGCTAISALCSYL